MSRDVLWSRPAEHDPRRRNVRLIERIHHALAQLAEDGRGDVRPLEGHEHEWHLRVGDWRVIFAFDEGANAIQVLRVLPRGRAYRR